MANNPAFAVVGHPNKGKSSIVSTLSQNDGIAISPQSGTTEQAEHLRIKTAHGSYTLIDTPGFQRPNRVLAWLQQHCDNASKRSAAVAMFVADDDCKRQFPDEVALLAPLVDGAAILYVVDGSRPYSTDYEAEMEILRWTGQPSMALINPIESSDCIGEWEQALGQYFKSVRIFNPMTADFDKQMALLNTFVHLNPKWSSQLAMVIDDLQQKRQSQKTLCVEVLAKLLDDLCRYQHCQKVLSEAQAKQIKPLLTQQFTDWLTKREKQAVDELLGIFAHHHTQVVIEQFDLPPDLFDCEQWFAWGLNKKQLTYAAATAGAVSGGAIDVALAGHSFMLGAIGGGVIGAGSAWLGANRLLSLKINGLPVGGYQACIGPITHRNFPYVIIGRFVYLYRQIAQLNHANRQSFSFNAKDFQAKVASLEKSTQKALHKTCLRLVKQKPVDDLPAILMPFFDLTRAC